MKTFIHSGNNNKQRHQIEHEEPKYAYIQVYGVKLSCTYITHEMIKRPFIKYVNK